VIIPEPGVYANLPAADYHRYFAASNSLLSLMDEKSPAHVLRSFGVEKKATPAQRLGDLVHQRFLTPNLYTFTRMEKINKTTKEGKAEFAALCEEYGAENLLDAETFDQVEEINTALMSNKTVCKLVESLNFVEHTIVWNDQKTGALCKGRIDGVTKLGVLFDLKTTVSAAREDFRKSIFDWGYYTQAAHYINAARHVGIDANHFVIIALEKDSGEVATFEIDEPTILAGQNQLNRLLPKWKKCVDSGIWPGYPQEIQMLGIPAWAINKLNERTIGESL